MSRQSEILSRIYQNLSLYGVKVNSIVSEQVYDRLTKAQDRIISDVFPDTVITITLVDGTDEYHLGTDATRDNIASIKVSTQPANWTYTFQFVPNKEFADFVNMQPEVSQPLKGTVIGGKLKIYPIPNSDYDGDELELYTYKSSSAGVINKTNSPEISNMFDTALEFFATGLLVTGAARKEMMMDFKEEITRLRPILNRKVHTGQAPKPLGW